MLEMRPTCLRCLRTAADCYCSRIRPFAPGARFVILQHPKEFRNRMGTARMARLCLANAVLVAGEREQREHEIGRLVSEAPGRSYLLYPGQGALALSEAFSGGTEKGSPTFFVIDATWSMSKKMVNQSPALASLPKVAFQPTRPSGYIFRKQPSPEFVSTIEAIHEVIDVLDRSGAMPVSPPGAHANLLEVFGWMAARQAAYSPQA
jgi:DTW domain-containing protein